MDVAIPSDGKSARVRSLGYLAKVSVLALVYVAVSKLGLMLDAVGGVATLVWPATGISLVALWQFGLTLWPGVALGAFVVSLWVGAPVALAAAIAVGNTLEAVIGAYALRRLSPSDYWPERLMGVTSLILLGAGLSTAVSATVGTVALLLVRRISVGEFSFAWRVWWLGDMVSDLIVAPALVAWRAWPRRAAGTRRSLEGVAVALATTLAALAFFEPRSVLTHAPLGPYLLFPPLIWAAFRFGPRAVANLTFFAAVAAVCGTAMGLGPFAIGSLPQRLLPLQAFMAMFSATGLLLGAAVAERKRAEAEAREAVRARDEFLSIASHELKTPLTSLQLQLEALGAKLKANPSSTGVPAKMQTILRQARRLGELIDNMLDVSRITSRRLHLTLEEVDFAALVQDVAARSEEVVSQAGSRLDLALNGPVWGHWDKERLHQVVDNLLSNAVKYGAGKPIEVSLQANAEAAVLQVRDRGIGISTQDQARIFQRFARAVSPRHYGGFGLGLWIARQIVEQLGGRIRVTSEVNQGSTFTVSLPYQRPDQKIQSDSLGKYSQ